MMLHAPPVQCVTKQATLKPGNGKTRYILLELCNFGLLREEQINFTHTITKLLHVPPEPLESLFPGAKHLKSKSCHVWQTGATCN